MGAKGPEQAGRRWTVFALDESQVTASGAFLRREPLNLHGTTGRGFLPGGPIEQRAERIATDDAELDRLARCRA